MSSKEVEVVSTKQVDYLDQDPEIRGQKFACVSFLSPEDVLRNKEVFFFSKFLAHIGKDVTDLFQNLSMKFAEHPHIVDMIKNIKERYDYLAQPDAMQEEYRLFKGQSSETLESQFYEQNNFQTSIRGFKVRGSYESLKEAQLRAEAIKKFDKKFDVYVAEVGCWCPWSPYAGDISDQEFAETQLNTMMKKYKENLDLNAMTYEARKAYMVEQNKKNAQLTIGTDTDVAEASAAADAANMQNEVLMEAVDPWMARKGTSQGEPDDGNADKA